MKYSDWDIVSFVGVALKMPRRTGLIFYPSVYKFFQELAIGQIKEFVMKIITRPVKESSAYQLVFCVKRFVASIGINARS